MLDSIINKSFNNLETSLLPPSAAQEKLVLCRDRQDKQTKEIKKTSPRHSSMYKRWLAEGTSDSNHRYVLIRARQKERANELAEEFIKNHTLPEPQRVRLIPLKGKLQTVIDWNPQEFQRQASSLLEKYLPEYTKLTLLNVKAVLGITSFFACSLEMMEDPELIIDYLDSDGLKAQATILITSQKVCI